MDSKQFTGNAFSLLDEAMIFADRHIPISSEFPTNQLQRIDSPLFPFKAMREIFANALAHKDYSFAGGSLNFSIYDDRIEIWNNGTLLPGITFNDLMKSHESMPRNPLIANIFYYHQLFESWGRGIRLILDECQNADLATPEFFERTGGFCVRIPTNMSMQKLSPKTTNLTADLSTRQLEILSILKDQPPMALREILDKLDAPPADRTLQEDMTKLKKLQLVASQSFGRGSKWQLAKSLNKQDAEKTRSER